MLVKVLVRKRKRRMKANSTREMINYPRTRGKERVKRIEAISNTVKAFVDVLDRALKVGLLFRSKFRSVTNFIWPYLHQFSKDSHGLNSIQKPSKQPFD